MISMSGNTDLEIKTPKGMSPSVIALVQKSVNATVASQSVEYDDEDKRTAEYGAKAAWCALMNELGYESPHKIPGLTEVSDDTTAEDTIVAADDIPHVTLKGNKVTELTISLVQTTKYFSQFALGKVKEANGGWSDVGNRRSMAVGYISTKIDSFGVTIPVAHIYYKVDFKPAGGTNTTKGDSAEAKVYEFAATASQSIHAQSTVLAGQLVTIMDIEYSTETAWIFENWGLLVPLPHQVTAPATIKINPASAKVGSTLLKGTCTSGSEVEVVINPTEAGTPITAVVTGSTWIATVPALVVDDEVKATATLDTASIFEIVTVV